MTAEHDLSDKQRNFVHSTDWDDSAMTVIEAQDIAMDLLAKYGPIDCEWFGSDARNELREELRMAKVPWEHMEPVMDIVDTEMEGRL